MGVIGEGGIKNRGIGSHPPAPPMSMPNPRCRGAEELSMGCSRLFPLTLMSPVQTLSKQQHHAPLARRSRALESYAYDLA